ncbi:MAG: NADH-quinone oxidoreductase subunit NuoK [Candidatus Margulisiibacteriota bacterium]
MRYIVLSLILFCIGLFGIITRRNAIAMLMSIELMLNAVNLNLVYFSVRGGDLTGQIFALFVIAVAAAEAAVGLAIIINVYRKFTHIDVERMTSLKW